MLATQTLLAKKMKNLLVKVDGTLAKGCSAKDIVLAIIGRIGTAGGTGSTIEFGGSAIRALSMEGRMTVCNMAIEAGARAGLVAVDDTTIDYVKGRLLAPRGVEWEQAVAHWRTLHSDPGRALRQGGRARCVADPAAGHLGHVARRWCCRSKTACPIPTARRTRPSAMRSSARWSTWACTPNKPMADIGIDKVFIGSCTNSRIEDLREAAAVVRRIGQRVAPNVKLAMVVPGSGLVKAQAEKEGLHEIFKAAGFEWREPGCSMCLAMNADRLEPGERCASTSNRNFEGPAGRRRPHPPGEPGDGRRRRAERPLRRRAAFRLKHRSTRCKPLPCTRESSRRWTAPTSTPTPSSRSSS